MTNCCDEISDPTPILVASRIAQDHDPIEAGSFVESHRIEKSWADEKLVIRSLFHNDRIVSGIGPRNDPLAIGSDTILWSWSADRIPQTPITIGSSDRKNTKPNSLLPIESWHKSFTGKFRIEITWSWLNEKRQTDDIYSWRHNGRCGDVIYECRYESVMASSVHAQCLLTIQHGLDMPYLTGVCMWLPWLKIYKLLTQDRPCSSKFFPVVCGF